MGGGVSWEPHVEHLDRGQASGYDGVAKLYCDREKDKRHTQTKLLVFATGLGRHQTHVRSRAAPTRGVLDP